MTRYGEALAFGNRIEGPFRPVGNDSFEAETTEFRTQIAFTATVTIRIC